MGKLNGIDYIEQLGLAKAAFEGVKCTARIDIATARSYLAVLKNIRDKLGRSNSENDAEFRIFRKVNDLYDEADRIIATNTPRQKPAPYLTVPDLSMSAYSTSLPNSIATVSSANIAPFTVKVTDEGPVSPSDIVSAADKEAHFIEEQFMLYGTSLSQSVLAEYAKLLETHVKAVSPISADIGRKTFGRLLDLQTRVRKALRVANERKEAGVPERRTSTATGKLGIVVREGQSDRLLPQTYPTGDAARAASRNLLKRLIPTLREEENDPYIDIGSTESMISLASSKTGKVYLTAVVVVYDAYAKDHPSNVIRET